MEILEIKYTVANRWSQEQNGGKRGMNQTS